MKTRLDTLQFRRSICLRQRRRDPGLVEMLPARQRAVDRLHGFSVAGKFVDQRRAIVLAIWPARDLARQYVGAGSKPRSRLRVGHSMGRLRKRLVLKNEYY